MLALSNYLTLLKFGYNLFFLTSHLDYFSVETADFKLSIIFSLRIFSEGVRVCKSHQQEYFSNELAFSEFECSRVFLCDKKWHTFTPYT